MKAEEVKRAELRLGGAPRLALALARCCEYEALNELLSSSTSRHRRAAALLVNETAGDDEDEEDRAAGRISREGDKDEDAPATIAEGVTVRSRTWKSSRMNEGVDAEAMAASP